MSTDFEPEPVPETTEPARDADGVPYCVLHHCRMTQTSGPRNGSKSAYYKCLVKGCEGKATILKVAEKLVPQNPQPCPRCSKAKKPVHCARDSVSSNNAMTILKCPECGWKSGSMVRPELAEMHLQQRPKRPVAGVGER